MDTEGNDSASLEEMIADAIARRVREFTLRIAAGELSQAERTVAATLGELWERALTSQERRYLACAFHCAQDPAMSGFAPLPLGCAVEHVLLGRLIAPLRTALQAQGRALPPPTDPKDYLGHMLHGHLTAEPPKALTLGPLIGLYGLALQQATGHPYPWQGYQGLGQQFAQATQPDALRLGDDAIRRRRLDALTRLVALRNRVAHPKHEAPSQLPTAQEFTAAWHAMVDDPDDAFFRYFPTAFPATPTSPPSQA